MSPRPQLPGRASRLTKNRPLPRTGVGQKSSAAELTGSPRLCGAPHGSAVLARRATQMSRPPTPPGRFEARYRASPSGDWIGQPSTAVVFSSELLSPISSIFWAGAHAEKDVAPARPATHTIARTRTPTVPQRRPAARFRPPPFETLLELLIASTSLRPFPDPVVAPPLRRRVEGGRPPLEPCGRIVGNALEAADWVFPRAERGHTLAPMQFRILGPLEVADGDGPRPLGGPKQRTVLAHLVLRANQAMDSERLIGEVWGDEPPPAARSTLRGYLSHLRKALGPDRLEHRSGGYILRAEPSTIDAVRFEALVDEGRVIRTADPATAVQIFERALALWRGPALADLTDQASLQPEIARLEELRLAALEDRIDAELELARHRELVPELQTLVAAHPFRERLWLHLMTALYRSDRQADALAAFQRARELLAEELGIDPSPELRRLQERVLRQDPSLDIAGEPLRGYRLLEQVGAGSFGSVHRAFQPQVGREVAIKTINPRFANDPEFIRRFEAEAQLVARLEHPHVVPLYDFWREPYGAYLVMRYLRGGSLRERLAHGPLGLQEAARLLDQMAQALMAAHRQGVVHRDVKPANILFDEDGNAYLSDFGIARDLATAEVATPGVTPSSLA